MSRTTVRIPIIGRDINKIMDTINDQTRAAGYQKKVIDGELVWAKGDGVFEAVGSIGAFFTEDAVIVQGWIKDAIAGELALNGFLASRSKEQVKALMDLICSRIYRC